MSAREPRLRTSTGENLKDSMAIQTSKLVLTSLVLFATYPFFEFISPLKDLV